MFLCQDHDMLPSISHFSLQHFTLETIYLNGNSLHISIHQLTRVKAISALVIKIPTAPNLVTTKADTTDRVPAQMTSQKVVETPTHGYTLRQFIGISQASFTMAAFSVCVCRPTYS